MSEFLAITPTSTMGCKLNCFRPTILSMEILREEEEAAQRSHRLVRSDCSAPVQTLLTGDGRDLCRLFRCSKRFLEQNSRLSHYTAAQPTGPQGAGEGQHFPGSRDHMWTRAGPLPQYQSFQSSAAPIIARPS